MPGDRSPYLHAPCLRQALVLLATLVVPALVQAQRAQAAGRPSRVRPAIRADAVLADEPGAQVAVGMVAAAAYNLRVGLDVGAGGVRRRGGGAEAAGRVDLLARWLSDPFRRSRRAIHAGGGIGVLVAQGAAPRPVAIVTLGVEGTSDGPWVPGVELGLGGGVRVGFTLRRAPARQR